MAAGPQRPMHSHNKHAARNGIPPSAEPPTSHKQGIVMISLHGITSKELLLH